MGRRRKADETDADENTSAAKRCKSTNLLNGVEIQWEWEGDRSIWTTFTHDLSCTITKAYKDKKKEVTLQSSAGVQLQIVFERMVQKNKKTGWERRIRCSVKADGEVDFHIWQWEDEHSTWQTYSADSVLYLEKANQENDTSVSFKAYGRDYTVDLSSMQQSNDATGVSRNVARIKSGAIFTEETDTSNDSTSIAKMPTLKKEPGSRITELASTSTASNKSKASGSKGKSSAAVKKSGEGRSGSTTKTLIMKGKAPIDPECTAKLNVAHVFDEGKDIYDCMLNQTNLQNNNNKYFLIQLLKDDAKNAYSVWLRWGRVGFKGQSNLIPFGPDLDAAKKTFCKKFSDKTKNDWDYRAEFEKVAGKYDMVHLDYKAQDKDETDGKIKPERQLSVPDSKLDPTLQELINLICDVKSMEDAVMEMKYDANKAPLGKLTSSQIKAGYAALKSIDTCIQKNSFGNALIQACDEFYTRIPHYFGMQRPPVIRTKKELKAKLDLLEALGDIEIAMKILNHKDSSENPIDTHYHDLKCDLKPIDKKCDTFKMLETYVKNTHAATHNQYTMKVMEVFDMEKENEKSNFKDYGNRMLLWHGSRLTNWMGILSQGLRIAPPEAPVTGYMFGKGLYFADMSSKSANYCFATKTKNVGLLLLSEVSLGNTNELLGADYSADKLPAKKNSVHGLGRWAPDPKKHHTTTDGMVVPLGKAVDTGTTNPDGYTLNYNEFIVYDPAQVRMRYLLKVQFNF